MHHGPSLSTNIVSVLMSQPVSRGLSDLSCACCQGSAGAWCDACAEALAPLLFPCVSVLTLDGAACHGTCTTRRNMHNSHNSSSNHKQVSRLQNDCWKEEIMIMLLPRFLQCLYNSFVTKEFHKCLCLCSSHANIICHSSQVASWSLL